MHEISTIYTTQTNCNHRTTWHVMIDYSFSPHYYSKSFINMVSNHDVDLIDLVKSSDDKNGNNDKQGTFFNHVSNDRFNLKEKKDFSSFTLKPYHAEMV